MWTIQEAAGRIFVLDQGNADLYEVIGQKMFPVVAVQGGSRQEDPDRPTAAEVLLKAAPEGLDRFPTWSGQENDRDLFVGQHVIEVNGVTYVGQVQPTTPEAQPWDEEAKVGPCELVVVEWESKEELVKESFPTRVLAWEAFDVWIEEVRSGKPVLQLEHANDQAQSEEPAEATV